MLRWDPDDRLVIQLDILTDAGLGLRSLVDIPCGQVVAPLHTSEDIFFSETDPEQDCVQLGPKLYAHTIHSPKPSFGAYANSIRQFRTPYKKQQDQARRSNAEIHIKEGIAVAWTKRKVHKGDFIYLDYGHGYS
jgi:hypothetical protein